MIRSMTGFGKGEAESKNGRVYMEIKSLNHKYFDLASRLPAGFLVFEDKIKTAIQKEVKRGRVNLLLDYDDFSTKNTEIKIDIDAAKKHVKQIKALKKNLGLSGEVTTQQILAIPGVVISRHHRVDTSRLWPLIKKALSAALKQLLISKEEEGRMLKKHLLQLCAKIDKSLQVIKKHTSQVKTKYKNKIVSSIKKITGSSKIREREKLEEEAAIFARNSDISEEICRIDAHIKAFKKAVANHKEVGRRLDFIAQEIGREANTIGAKADSFWVTKEIIKVKSHVEKIREQTQNVE